MEIVIKIPKEAKQAFDCAESNDLKGGYYDHGGVIGIAIKNGTPLPEHHGRLGDLDALEENFRNIRKELKASDYKNAIDFFVRDEMLLNFQQFVHLCDAIIEGSDSE